MIQVNEQNEDGYGIEKVLVSPYQIVVYGLVPYTVLTENDMLTREDFVVKYGDLPYEEADVIAVCEQDKKDRLGTRVYEDKEFAVFNEKGEIFEAMNGGDNITVYAVQNMDKEKLHIFVASEPFSIGPARNIDDARSKAIFETEVETK